jgi:hypothetical protein
MLFLNASFNKTTLVRYILYRHAWWWEVRKNIKKAKFVFLLVPGPSGMRARNAMSIN